MWKVAVRNLNILVLLLGDPICFPCANGSYSVINSATSALACTPCTLGAANSRRTRAGKRPGYKGVVLSYLSLYKLAQSLSVGHMEIGVVVN